MAAFFTQKQGGTIAVLKLIKLLYLSDRESMDRYGAPISFDYMTSLRHGPILSTTKNLIDGDFASPQDEKWEEWFSGRENYDVSIKRSFDRNDLDHLSDADLAVLQTVWERFGHMSKWELRDYTHRHCPEWTDPHGSSLPIKEIDLLRILGTDSS
jgi:uncharacterized phage-associated protein